MIIHTVTTKNFLSLRDCTVDLLSPHLNFFVGSNGSGKTSLLRAIKELTEAFESIGSVKVKTFNHLYNIQSETKQIDVDVKVTWNTEEEKKVIYAFLCASLTPLNSMYEGLRKWQKLSAVY